MGTCSPETLDIQGAVLLTGFAGGAGVKSVTIPGAERIVARRTTAPLPSTIEAAISSGGMAPLSHCIVEW